MDRLNAVLKSDTDDSSDDENERMMDERISNMVFPLHHHHHSPVDHPPMEVEDEFSPMDDFRESSQPSDADEENPNGPGIAERLTTPMSNIENAEQLFMAEHETAEVRKLSVAMNITTTFLQDILDSVEIGTLSIHSRPDIRDDEVRAILRYICTTTESTRTAYVRDFNIYTDITDALDRKRYIDKAMFVYFQRLFTLYLGRDSSMIHHMKEVFWFFGRFTRLGRYTTTAGCNWPAHVRQSIDQIQTILTNVENRIHSPVHI
ncbi:hypothetical protein T484DRAFT_1758443 [Baffinella frigidus]|nr:hypothetical protein T484DRAFT_1758443 [Cryptophyta sp. CCMP2293]